MGYVRGSGNTGLQFIFITRLQSKIVYFFKRQIGWKVHLQRVTFRGREIVKLHLVEKVMMPVEMQCPGPPVRLLCVLLILYSLYILPLYQLTGYE